MSTATSPPSDARDVVAITDRPHMVISSITLSTLENVLSHVLEHPNHLTTGIGKSTIEMHGIT